MQYIKLIALTLALSLSFASLYAVAANASANKEKVVIWRQKIEEKLLRRADVSPRDSAVHDSRRLPEGYWHGRAGIQVCG